MPHDQNEKDYFMRRKGAMETKRASFISHYKDLDQYVQPRSAHFQPTDANRGNLKHRHIINSHGTQALGDAVAGIVAGTMPPTRPWFQFEPGDPELLKFQPVKVWLKMVEGLIFRILNASNYYNMAPTLVMDMLLYATGCMTHVDDFEDVARFYAHPAGSYMIAQDDRFIVNTLVREFDMTVLAMISQFGLDNVGTSVQSSYDRGDYEIERPVVNFIEPNPDADDQVISATSKPFRSVYFELDDSSPDKFLSRGGFDEFPAYVPRWDVTGTDIYGTSCPGMVSLGDIKMLQVMERRKAQGIDKMVNPPLQGPPSLHNASVNSAANGMTIYDGGENGTGLRPVYTVNPQLQEMSAEIQRTENRIGKNFFGDLFFAISRIEGIQPRNELDLTERNQERLTRLGPVLERIHGELLERVVNRVFNQAIRAGIVPPAPAELQGQELDTRFISSLALAQRAVATTGIERVTAFAQGLSQTHPEVTDKLDADQAVEEYSQAIGTSPKIIVPDDVVQARREARARARAQEQQMQQAERQASVAKTSSEASLEGDTVLSRQTTQG